jgi:hypothetical protein
MWVTVLPGAQLSLRSAPRAAMALWWKYAGRACSAVGAAALTRRVSLEGLSQSEVAISAVQVCLGDFDGRGSRTRDEIAVRRVRVRSREHCGLPIDDRLSVQRLRRRIDAGLQVSGQGQRAPARSCSGAARTQRSATHIQPPPEGRSRDQFADVDEPALYPLVVERVVAGRASSSELIHRSRQCHSVSGLVRVPAPARLDSELGGLPRRWSERRRPTLRPWSSAGDAIRFGVSRIRDAASISLPRTLRVVCWSSSSVCRRGRVPGEERRQGGASLQPARQHLLSGVHDELGPAHPQRSLCWVVGGSSCSGRICAGRRAR